MKIPFNMLIIGSTECGKTHYLLNLLNTKYVGAFGHIFLLCPTYEFNKTYQETELIDRKIFESIPCEQDDIEELLKQIVTTFKGTNSLIILDDCAASKHVKTRTSELVKLAFSARHFGFSTVVITQKLTAITPSYRDNAAKVVVFDTPNNHTWKLVTDEFLDVPDITKIRDELKTKKHARLEISLRFPRSYKVVVPKINNEC